MADLPHPWGIYARLQKNLRCEYRVGDRSWGTEAGMDHILESAFSLPPTEDEVNQVIAASRRRDRHRNSSRESFLEDISTAHPEGALSARSELAAIRRKVGDHNWDILAALAMGSSYQEVTTTTSLSVVATRVKVLRLRALLAAAA